MSSWKVYNVMMEVRMFNELNKSKPKGDPVVERLRQVLPRRHE